jgi:CheY-like chemotaxis protein
MKTYAATFGDTECVIDVEPRPSLVGGPSFHATPFVRVDHGIQPFAATSDHIEIIGGTESDAIERAASFLEHRFGPRVAALERFSNGVDPGVREAVGFLLRSIGLHAQLFASAPIDDKDGFAWVGHTSADSYRELLAITPPTDPACVLLDVRMPGISGLDCQRQMSAAGFRIPVLFMTGHGDIRCRFAR